MFDDYWNIVDNPSLKIETLSLDALTGVVVSGSAGPTGRPLSMLSFAVNYRFCGFEAGCFKAANLLLHFANGVLVFLFGRLLFRRINALGTATFSAAQLKYLPLLFGSLWLAAPINLTSVLYVVQRMNSLAGFFTLLGLVVYLWGREKSFHSNWALYVYLPAVLVCTALATLAKENGILLLTFIFVCEICFYQFITVDSASSHKLKLFFILVLFIPLVLTILYFVFNTEWLSGKYAIREFSLAERLLTEARAIWFYLRLILFPTNATLGIYHDDFVLSTGLFSPVTTLISIIALVVITGIAIKRRVKSPVFSFAVLWFLAGHLMESTVLPLEIMHEHRNYIPSIGPLFALVYCLQQPGFSSRIRSVLVKVLCGILVYFALVTGLRSLEWGNKIGHIYAEVQHHPGSSRTQYELGRLLLEVHANTGVQEQLDQAEKHFLLAVTADKDNLLPLFGLIHLAFYRDKQPDESLLRSTRNVLETTPINLGDTNLLQRLVICNQSQFCDLDPNEMLGLFGSILKNPSLTVQSKHNILVHLASYYIGVLGDLVAAQRIMEDIVKQDPEVIPYQLGLIHVKIEAGLKEEALQLIQLLREKISATDWSMDKAQQIKMLNEIQARAISR